MSESVKELEDLVRKVKKGLRPKPRLYPPKEHLVSKRGRKRKYQSNAERQRAYRNRKKATLFIS